MTISRQPPTALLDSVLAAQSTREKIAVAVLDKAQEVTQQQGEAAVQLIEQAGAIQESGRLDAYA